MPKPTTWTDAKAPSLAEFEELAAVAWNRLPKAFRELCTGVSIQVEDFPTDDVVEHFDLETPFDIMGLYQGVDLAHKSVMDVPQVPDMVFLYRRPILDYWAEHDETLGHLVTHVLVHEIGHHFGLSDEDMEAIEREAS